MDNGDDIINVSITKNEIGEVTNTEVSPIQHINHIENMVKSKKEERSLSPSDLLYCLEYFFGYVQM